MTRATGDCFRDRLLRLRELPDFRLDGRFDALLRDALLREEVLRDELFRPVDLRPPDFRALDFRALDFRALDFRALDFRALDFRALDFRALDLRPLDLRAPDLRPRDPLLERELLFLPREPPRDDFLAAMPVLHVGGFGRWISKIRAQCHANAVDSCQN